MHRLFPIGLGCVLLMSGLTVSAPAQDDWTVESDQLRLEVDGSSGYDFQLIDKATSDTLVSQNALRMGDNQVTGISGVTTTANSLDATLSFDGGATAQLNFEFTNPQTLKVNLNGTAGFDQRFNDTGQRYYGTWAQPLGGTTLDNDELSGSRRYNGKDQNAGDVQNMNARAPFYMTDRGIGYYAETTSDGAYDFQNNTGFDFETPDLTYHLIDGGRGQQRYKNVLDRYNDIAGPSFRPPDWAYGATVWRNDYTDIPGYTGASNAQELVLKDIETLSDLEIPMTATWIDRPWTTGSRGWGGDDYASDFPNPDQMVQEINDAGVKPMVWIANRALNELKSEAPSGSQFNGSTSWDGLDIRDPDVEAHFKDYLNDLLDDAQLEDGSPGIHGYKIDRGGEGALAGTQNELVPLFEKLAFEVMQDRHGTDFLNFARNLNDKSRKHAAFWNGDPRSTWEAYESTLLNAIRGGLINQPLFGSDTGGYFGRPSRELFARWLGFSAFSPRMHLKFDEQREKPFYDGSDPELVNLSRKLITARHERIPYVRSLMEQNINTGLAPIRAMVVEFPDDPTVADMGDQYMYGQNMLVAPVLADSARDRDVYLPEGEWINYNDRGSRYQSSGQTVNVSAPLDEVPVFVRAGAIIPNGEIIQGNNTWDEDWQPWLNLEVFVPSADEATTSFEYFTGEGLETITLDKTDDAVSLSFDDLLLDGELLVYLDEQTRTKLDEEDWAVWLDDQRLDQSEFELVDGLLTTAYTGDTQLTLTAVPEPASLGIVAAGALMLLPRRRKAGHGPVPLPHSE